MTDMSPADYAAVTGGSNNNGWGGSDGALLMLLIIALLGGFGNNRGFGGGYGGGYGAGGVGGNELYPWLSNADNVNNGFRDQMINGTINATHQSVQSLATQLCGCCGDIQAALCNGFAGVNANMSNGFAGVNMAIAQGFAGVEAGANARQMADMQQQFAMQTAMMQGFTGVQGQTAQLASDIQLGNAQQTATILAENCADRAALSDGVRDIIAAQNAGTQRILDKLCDQELFAERRENDNLRQQLNMQTLAASQAAQNAFIQQGFANEVDQLYNRLNTCPVPSMPVYGRTPIFQCQPQNPGCGCGYAVAA